MFSKACEYAIRASIYVARSSARGRRVSLKDIAAEIGSPVAFTAKILQQLARNGIIDSIKGPTGGFEILPEKMDELYLSDIVQAIDGNGIFTACGLGLKQCSALQPCPVHEQFKSVRDALKKMLETTSMKELSGNPEKSLTFLR